VVTNAHVVAGVHTPYVDRYGGHAWRALVVAFDVHNDLAVLRVSGLSGTSLRTAVPDKGTPVVVLGYPEDGPLRGVVGRLGKTVPTLARDAYGRFPQARLVTPIRAEIRPGNSGGPVIDGEGRVRAIVFARRAGADGGFGVPVQLVNQLVHDAGQANPIGTPCADS
jgi:S1-C subfamily serine protease